MNFDSMEVTQIRRENLRELAKSVGGISKLAAKLHKSQSQISHLIGISPLKKLVRKWHPRWNRLLVSQRGG